MENAKKTNSFLSAIEKYAKQQKDQMVSEVEKFKADELKKAEEEGLKEAYNIIQSEIASKKTQITSQLARREQQAKMQLFSRRKEMTDEIFCKVRKKLLDYSKKDEYKEKLIANAKKASELVNGKSCVLFVKQDDTEFAKQLAKHFGKGTEIKAANDIQLGGFRCYCEELSIIIDETLDSKLSDQEKWFAENSTLRVV